MGKEARLVCSQSPETFAARLRVAVAEPLGTAIEDAVNLRLTARPGDRKLVGRVDGMSVTVWRRGSGTWVGANRFAGQLRSTETGTELVGAVRSGWVTLVSYASFVAMAIAVLALTSTVSSGRRLVGEAIFFALGAPWFVFIQRRDRRLLVATLQELAGSESAAK